MSHGVSLSLYSFVVTILLGELVILSFPQLGNVKFEEGSANHCITLLTIERN